MNKAEAFDKATRLAMKGDLKLYDEIVHSDYESMNQQVSVNKEMSKSILSGIGNLITVGPMQRIYENEEFVCIHRYSRVANTEIFNSVMTAITYKNGKVVNQQTVREELDYDPSDGQDWKWEDYE
jgi:c-di-GMP-related signal transduction protein